MVDNIFSKVISYLGIKHKKPFRKFYPIGDKLINIPQNFFKDVRVNKQEGNIKSYLLFLEFNAKISYHMVLDSEDQNYQMLVNNLFGKEEVDLFLSYHKFFDGYKHCERETMTVNASEVWVSICNKDVLFLRPTIGVLQNLKTLQICCNHLVVLPEEICELVNLVRLVLARNKLISLPKNIGKLKNLKEFNAAHNNLSSLPETFSSLKRLTLLILSSNNFKGIPKQVSGCFSLIHFYFYNNMIDDIPIEFTLLPWIQAIGYSKDLIFHIKKKKKNPIHNALTLEEICARKIISTGSDIPNNSSKWFVDKLKTVQECFYCSGPFFDCYYEKKLEKIFKEDLIVYKAKMCSEHFNDEEEFKRKIFHQPRKTFPSLLCNKFYPKISELFSITSYSTVKLKEILAYNKRNKKKENTKPLFTLAEGYEKVNLVFIERSKDMDKIDFRNLPSILEN